MIRILASLADPEKGRVGAAISDGAPRVKSVPHVRRPCGATSRPHNGSFLRSQRLWFPAAGMRFMRCVLLGFDGERNRWQPVRLIKWLGKEDQHGK